MGLKSQTNENGVLEIAIKAFRDSLGFLKDYFEKTQIFELALDCLLSASRNPDADISTQSLMCLNDFVHIHYQKIANYVSPIYNVLSGHLLNDNADIAMQAVDVWSTIALEEINRKTKFVINFHLI